MLSTARRKKKRRRNSPSSLHFYSHSMEDRNTQDGGSEDYPGTGPHKNSSLQTLRDYLPLLVFAALIAIGIYLVLRS